MQNGVEFKALPIVPNVGSSPELINDEVTKLEGLGLGRSLACFVVSTGSKLEVASMSLVLNRSYTDVTYISFLWGFLGGTYYPLHLSSPCLTSRS